MYLVEQPQFGIAVLAGLLLGSLILVVLVLAEGLRTDGARGAHFDSGAFAGEDGMVYLFEDRSLIQTTEEASAGLSRLDGARADETKVGDDWTHILHLLRPRFATLPDDPEGLDSSGRNVLLAHGADDGGYLIVERWGRYTRLTLAEDRLRSQPPEQETQSEAVCLRQAVTGAPYPIWQSDEAGKVIWANDAYQELVRCFTSGKSEQAALSSELTSLFDAELSANREATPFRASITPVGASHPYWFDLRSLRLENGWMNYATDVNAVVNAEIAQRNFVQTLTKTFAQLSIGLAIFDRKRQLALFNPALIDLTTLPAEFLSARPNLLSFFDRLRDRRMMPEPKNYRSWRDQITDLVAAADTGQYRETWTLPSGMTYRISGRPHPDGAVAFLFEDISAEISSTRRYRSQLELGQSVLNTLDQAIAVFSASGILAFSNNAYRDMWGIDPDSTFADISVNDASRHWQEGSHPTPVWGDLRDFVVQFGDRSDWQADVVLKDGRSVTCQVVPMTGGTTLVTFQVADICLPVAPTNGLRTTV